MRIKLFSCLYFLPYLSLYPCMHVDLISRECLSNESMQKLKNTLKRAYIIFNVPNIPSVELVFAISRNPSSPISLYPSLFVSSLSPIPLFYLEITLLLYLRTRAHQWPRKSELLEIPLWNGRPRYATEKGASLWRTQGNHALEFKFAEA